MASTLRVGAAHIEITPPQGTQIAGSVGLRRFAESVMDPLYARATVFEAGGKKVCLLVIDVTIISLPITEQVRAGAAKLGFDPDAVMVQATQTHTAPGLGHFVLDRDIPGIGPEADFIRGADPKYDKWIVPKLIEVIAQADANLRRAKLGSGSAYEGRLAFNRRGVTKDGTVVMPWNTDGALGPTHVKYMEGPIDPELGVIAIRGEDDKVRSLLVHYTCHPVCVYYHGPGGKPPAVISADWPGAVCDELIKRFSGCEPVVVNGACGDVNPWPAFEPGFWPDHKRIGASLAELANKVVDSLSFSDVTKVDYRVRNIRIPVRQPEPEKLKAAQEYLQKNPEPVWIDPVEKTQVDWPWMQAAGVLSVELLRRREPLFEYEIQVLRIGDTAIVGLPGEPFAIGGLRVKAGSPAKTTFIAHLTTQYVGYLPTREAFRGGGHEVNTSHWAKFVPEALDMAVENAIEVVNEMFTEEK